MSEPFILILLGIIGVVLHSLGKMKSLQEMSRSANVKFHWYNTYVKKDAIAIIMSFLAVVVWYLCFGEVGAKYPIVVDFKRLSFMFAGIIGSYVIQFTADLITNSARKQIQKYIDVKTNIADITAKVHKNDTLLQVIEKGTEATGVDVTKAPPAPKDVPVADSDDKKPT